MITPDGVDYAWLGETTNETHPFDRLKSAAAVVRLDTDDIARPGR